MPAYAAAITRPPRTLTELEREGIPPRDGEDARRPLRRRRPRPPRRRPRRVAGAPHKLNEAHAGTGSVSFTTCSLFNVLTGAKPTRIAYRGTGPALNDLVSGQVDYMCDQIVNLVPQIQAGTITIKAYAVALPARSPALPDVPTTKEAGLPEFEVTAWNAIFAPKGTPKDIVQKLNGALVKALDDAATRKRLLDLGADLSNKAATTPEGLRKLVESEVPRWKKVLASTGQSKEAAGK